jgi:putative transposase
MLFSVLRRAGKPWNHKRVHRIYCQLGWNKVRKKKRRLPSRNPRVLDVPLTLNASWSMDFMSDSLWNGQKYRTFNVIDDCNREALGIEVDTNLPAARVCRTLDRIAEFRGYPAQIRCDNGPEFISALLADWASGNSVHLEFIEPGKPTQNSFIERFNRSFREGVLDTFVFDSLRQVRTETEKWVLHYNERRPHSGINQMTPAEKRDNLNPRISSD